MKINLDDLLQGQMGPSQDRPQQQSAENGQPGASASSEESRQPHVEPFQSINQNPVVQAIARAQQAARNRQAPAGNGDFNTSTKPNTVIALGPPQAPKQTIYYLPVSRDDQTKKDGDLAVSRAIATEKYVPTQQTILAKTIARIRDKATRSQSPPPQNSSPLTVTTIQSTTPKSFEDNVSSKVTLPRTTEVLKETASKLKENTSVSSPFDDQSFPSFLHNPVAQAIARVKQQYTPSSTAQQRTGTLKGIKKNFHDTKVQDRPPLCQIHSGSQTPIFMPYSPEKHSQLNAFPSPLHLPVCRKLVEPQTCNEGASSQRTSSHYVPKSMQDALASLYPTSSGLVTKHHSGLVFQLPDSWNGKPVRFVYSGSSIMIESSASSSSSTASSEENTPFGVSSQDYKQQKSSPQSPETDETSASGPPSILPTALTPSKNETTLIENAKNPLIPSQYQSLYEQFVQSYFNSASNQKSKFSIKPTD